MIGYDSEMEFYAALDGQQSGEFEIFGNDDRRFVANTLDIPFRFVCCLDLVFRNPNGGALLRLRGSGTLISDRHVLTVAHNVFDDISVKNPALRQRGMQPFPIRFLRAERVVVAPARNGRELPANFTMATHIRVAPRWQAVATRQQAQGNARHLSTDSQDDFALLTLNTPLGGRPTNVITMQLPAPPLGFWGHPRFGGGTRIRPIELNKLRNQMMNVSGYPIDKCLDQPRHRPATPAELAACTGHIPGDDDFKDQGSTQWVSTGTILDPSPAGQPRLITYDADMIEGQSGAPVWLRWEQFRNLVAINTGGSPRATAPFDIVANSGVRITAELLTQIRAWMRLDGVQPTF